jgi:hypothetical protein
VDIRDIKMQKEATIAQLRALNALLERQVREQPCSDGLAIHVLCC